ncbi:MAG TPA: lipopolysaccharide assembly protein LapA domain-containing protein [Candidatus Dormibacteraeota bacterium]|nr:lipopolysaccharide assembly protein LapA domain-containing protein [Candidatus Dormibacteraeota bacterium]
MDEPTPPAGGHQGDPGAPSSLPLRTGVSATWTALALGTVMVVLILVFILQNLRQVEVNFLVFSGRLPLGAAILCGAVAGVVITFAVGAARILQLRLVVRASSRRAERRRASPLDRPVER